jgi:hypothetical protein
MKKRPIRECVKIVKLLKILDEEMVNLKLLAVQHKWETFYLKIFDFSRKLYRVRQLIDLLPSLAFLQL